MEYSTTETGGALYEPTQAVSAWAETNGSAVIAARHAYDDSTGVARPRYERRSTDVRPCRSAVFAPPPMPVHSASAPLPCQNTGMTRRLCISFTMAAADR